MGNDRADRGGSPNNPMPVIVVGTVVASLAYASGALGRAGAHIGATLQSTGVLLGPGTGMVDVGPFGSVDLPRIVVAILVAVAVAALVRVVLRRRAIGQMDQRGR